MRNKLLCALSVLVVALSLFLFAGCSSCGGCGGKTNELKSSTGVTLSGGGFGKQAKLITDKIQLTEDAIPHTLDRLPEEYQTLTDSEIVAMDISVQDNGVKVQPDGKVRISVPAPIAGVKKYLVFHIKSETEVEELDCTFENGNLMFETDSFSVFIFVDPESGERVTVKNQGPCRGTVDVVVKKKMFYHEYEQEFHVGTDEEKTFFIKKGTKVELNQYGTSVVDHLGWYREIDGVIEETPVTTLQFYTHYVQEGEQSFVARFEGHLYGVYQIWPFPGESNMPVEFRDGRAASTVYIKPGNPKQIDVSKLVIKGWNNKGKYVILSPEQYEVTGLDEIDYSKEGNYYVDFTVKKDPNLSHRVCVYVSGKNGDVTVKTVAGGSFYIGENNKESYTEKSLLFTNGMPSHQLTAVPDEKFDFGGWYTLYEGGIIGDLISEDPVYELKMPEYDLTVLALFQIKPAFSELKEVYQLRLWSDASGIPTAGESGEEKKDARTVLYYKPGAPETDFLKLDIRGLRRNENQPDGNVYEFVKLFFGDYSINFGGLDFRREGDYKIYYTLHFSTVDRTAEDRDYLGFIVYVSEKFAHLTVGLEGNGTVEESRGYMPVLTRSSHRYVFDYFNAKDFRELIAKPADGYRFIGWYSVDEAGNLSASPVSVEPKYKYRQNGTDLHIKAVFVEDIRSLNVTCNGFEQGNFYYSLSDKTQADLTGLTVTTNNGTVLDASEYTVDASRVDYTKTGVYEITVSYRHDKTVKATLTVTVPKAETYSYLENGDMNGVIEKDGRVVVRDPDGYREETDLGGTLTLTAVPNEGFRFAGWYVVNSFSEEKRFYSSNATETFTITDNTYIYARFAEKGKVTLKVIAGENGNLYDLTTEGYSPAEKQLQFEVTEGTRIRVSASGETVYFRFVGWYNGAGENAALISAEEVYEFTVTEDATVYARFDYAFSVSARIESHGAGEFVGAGISDEDGFYVDNLTNGASVTVEVKPKAGYHFIGWFPASDSVGYNADSLLSTNLKYTVTVSEETGNIHLTALFRGTVTEIKLDDLGDFGFDTDENGNLKAEYRININSEVWAPFEEIPVLGKVGDRFERLCRGVEYRVESTIGCSENGMLDTGKAGIYTVTYTYLANPAFKAVITIRIVEEYRFLAQCYEYQWGYITENGQQVEFGNGRMVERGTQITLTAVANEGYRFLGWYFYNEQQAETLISEDAAHTFTVEQNLYVFAKFAQKEMYRFIAYPSDTGYITENGQQVEFGNGRMVEKGTQITLTANAKEQEYRFVGWYFYNEQQAETLISEDATHTFTVDRDLYVFARFAQKERYQFIAYPTEAGYITENGQQVEFGNGRMVEKGTQITLTANAKEQEYRFVGWYLSSDQNESLISAEATYTFTVNENMYVYAKFERTETGN